MPGLLRGLQTSLTSCRSGVLSLSASSSHSGHRWQCLWGQQLRLSPLANTERLRLRHLAQCKDCRTGLYGYEVSLQAGRVAGGLGDREWGSATFILSQAKTWAETGLAAFLEIILLP